MKEVVCSRMNRTLGRVVQTVLEMAQRSPRHVDKTSLFVGYRSTTEQVTRSRWRKNGRKLVSEGSIEWIRASNVCIRYPRARLSSFKRDSSVVWAVAKMKPLRGGVS
ncbi:uncharacterized protein LOC122527140 [Frieseomelitta varia]|uniref:uncharacterized protein LOC122527140 n=1 Tax=Frieseomelitta varia TaxID=561572 RepID=UPI001CB6A4FC|nr:uncharacterized protein LOC122527140 [Frieseomelitta varia]